MECNHPRIKSVNCVLSCMDCGAILSPDFLTAVIKHQEEPAQEAPKKPRKRAKKEE